MPRQFLMGLCTQAVEYIIRGGQQVTVSGNYGCLIVMITLNNLREGQWSISAPNEPPMLITTRIDEVEAHLKRIAA